MTRSLAWIRRYSLIWLGILFGLAFYAADALMDVYLFKEGSLLEQIFHPNPIEAWMRLSVLTLSITFGIYAHILLKRSRAAEQSLSAIIQNIPDMVFIKEADELRFVQLNLAGEKLLGHTSEQVLGKNDYDLFPREQADAFTAKDREVLNTGRELHIAEEIIDTKMQGKRYLHTKKVPLKDSHGHVAFLLGISEDITERKNSEIALAREKDRAERYLHISEAMIVELDHKGDITLINRRGCEILGYDEDELLGNNWFTCIAPESNRETLRGVFTRIMTGDYELFSHYENEVLRKNGETRYIAWNNTLKTTDDGKICGVLSSGQDITERKRYEDQLRLASIVFQSSNQGILVTDSNNMIISINPAFTEITGYTFDDVRGKNPSYLKSDLHHERFYKNLWHSLTSEDYWKGEIWDRRKDGTSYPSWQTISTIRSDTGEVTNYVSIFSDITPIKQEQESLSFLAHHDPMTQLPNRMMLDDRLDHALRRHQRNHNQIAIFFIDLDDFKYVNDTFGHATGDHLLRAIAKRLQDMFRNEDTIARFGGDEFVIVIESFESRPALELIAGKIIKEVSTPLSIDGNEIVVGTSIGIAIAPSDGTDPQSLLRSADKAMYKAKTMGRNRYHFYSDGMQ